MIFFKETFTEFGEVSIQIEGVLDRDSIHPLREICTDHLVKKRKLSLNLEKVNRIDNENLAYLRSIRKQVRLDGLNQYLKLELDETEFEKERG